MNQYQDPERLTDDKDWTVIVNSERRADGLCMDTLSGSTKLRRKASIPSVNQILGASEEVPDVPVVSSQIKSADKQNGRNTTPSSEPQASAGTSCLNQGASHNVVTAAQTNSPEVVQRSEYTWETLLCEPSDIRIKRSQSFNWDELEYRKPNGTTRSWKLNKQDQVKRSVRSKSLRGYTNRELTVLRAADTVPSDKIVISVKRDDNPKRNKSKKSPTAQRTVNDAGNKMTKAEGIAKKKKINRSGSAPSMRAKEKVTNTDLEGSLNRRNSFRWIPDPDYQTVSMEELVSAAQQQVKATRKDNVCVVEIHNVPRDRDPKVNTSVGTTTPQVVDASSSNSIQQSSRLHEDQANYNTTVDVKTILPIPGVARRVPTVLPNDQSPDKNEETKISIKNTHDGGLSVKNHVQNNETQIVDVQPNTRHSQATASITNYTVDIRAPLTTDINNNSQTLPNWRQKQTAREARHEPNIDRSQIGQPSFKTKPEVRSIGKLTLVKHVETPTRGGNPQITPNNTIRDDPTKSFENAPSIQMKQLTDISSPRNVTLLVRNSDEQRDNETPRVPFCAPPPAPPPPPPPFTEDSWCSRQALGNEVKITIAPKDSQDAISVLKEPNVPIARDTDMNLTLEERKKTWKREQIVDQLHSARAKNGNQNYIFGTGLAYQSCMPELQNKLKQLALAK